MPYEVCVMLPEINPYSELDSRHYAKIYNDTIYGEYVVIFHTKRGDSPSDSEVEYTTAWTIIDALTWLENEKQKTIEVRPQYTRHKTTPVAWEVILNGEKKIEEKGTRIDAYIAGIKYTLKEL